MKNLFQNINICLSLGILLLTIFVSCGPRSGLHEEKETQLVCGNVAMESENFDKIKNLKLSGDPYSGKKIFKQNCFVCHTVTDQKLTGPGLAGVYDRVPQPAEDWLIKFISNNNKVILSGDPYANKIYNDYGTGMLVYDTILSEKEIRDVIAYIVAASN